MTISLLDLKRQLTSFRPEIDAAISRVIDSANFILGSEVSQFEENLAQYCNTRFAIGCASGSDALLISLYAAGVQPGDRVVTSAYTFFATAGAILRLGAIPVFVDIDPDTYNMDTRLLEHALRHKPSAIIPFHMFGQMCPMVRIRAIAGVLPVLEDAAQPVGEGWHGETIGAHSTAACLSFFPSKNLGGFGDGGAILTNHPEVAEACRMLRAHGAKVTYYHERLGMNSRLDALQAAVLDVKLTHLDAWIELRQRHAAAYKEAFDGTSVKTPLIRNGAVSVFNQYTIQLTNRDIVKQHLDETGIGNAIYYPVSLPDQPCFSKFKDDTIYPASVQASGNCLSIPIFPELTHSEQQTITKAIISVAED